QISVRRCATFVMSTWATLAVVMNKPPLAALVFTLSPSCSSCRGLVFTVAPGDGQSRPSGSDGVDAGHGVGARRSGEVSLTPPRKIVSQDLPRLAQPHGPGASAAAPAMDRPGW